MSAIYNAYPGYEPDVPVLYQYHVPLGFGDTFFIYAFDAQGAGFVNGNDYLQQGIKITDGKFLMRYVQGAFSMAAKEQVYDWQARRLFAAAANLGSFHEGMVVLPELEYPNNGNIRFDVLDVNQAVAGVSSGLTVYRSQLAFYGVRRRPGVQSDPAPSAYRYYQKPYSIPYSLVINQFGAVAGELTPPQMEQIKVEDFDFELRRIELQLPQGNGGSDPNASRFKILLFDQNKLQVSNIPILSNLFCHLDPAVSQGELNFNPSPPLLYKVNSTIRFQITSLLFAADTLPATFQLLFHGVRRIPC